MLLKKLFNLKNICREVVKNKDALKNDDRYIYDIENDTLQKTDIKNFENEYNTINSFTDEYFGKYENTDLQIVIFNKNTNKEKRYALFN